METLESSGVDDEFGVLARVSMSQLQLVQKSMTFMGIGGMEEM
jgi:hypothetical protein